MKKLFFALLFVLTFTKSYSQEWQCLNTNLIQGNIRIDDVSLINDSTIYGVGKFYLAKYFIKSTDLGQTWTVTDLSDYATGMIDVEFISKDTGFISGYHKYDSLGGVILYTTDGGITWQEKYRTNLPGQAIWKLQNLDNKHWYGSIQPYPNQPVSIIKSVDSGATWTYHTIDTISHYLQVIGFVNKTKGWTGGKQLLYETNDGGLTWQIKPSCNTNFDRFQRVNDTLAYMTGKSFMRFSNRPLVTGIQNQYLNEPYHLIRLKPNPVKLGEKLTIEIDQSSDTYAELGIVDMQGRFIEVIQKTIQPKGKYNYQINIDDKYSAGMYTIYFYTNEGMESLNFSIR